MAEVTALRREPNADCVAKIEALLAQCRKGEVVAFGYAVILAGNEGIQTSFVTGDANVFTLFGAIERLKFRLHGVTMED